MGGGNIRPRGGKEEQKTMWGKEMRSSEDGDRKKDERRKGEERKSREERG